MKTLRRLTYSTIDFNTKLKRGDFKEVPEDDTKSFKEELVRKTVKYLNTEFRKTNPLEVTHIKNKKACKFTHIEGEIIERLISHNIRYLTGVSPPDRHAMTRNVLSVLMESLPYNIFKIDISRFYESFIIEDVINNLNEIDNLPQANIEDIHHLLMSYRKLGGQGLPRGIQLSAWISEFMMKSLDDTMRRNKNIFFYSRYVDDIIIVTNPKILKKEVHALVKNKLPKGLGFNYSKCRHFHIDNKTRQNAHEHFSLDYLGYNYKISSVIKQKKYRAIEIDIAQSKKVKIKTRIARSFIDFAKNRDDLLLIDRVKYLTSNFSIVDFNTGQRRISGIYHNYPLLTDPKNQLNDLDNFLASFALSRSGRIQNLVSPILGNKVKRTILGHKFTDGYIKKRFVYFSPNNIGKIKKCWSNA